MKKRIVSLVAILALVASLTGCNKPGKGPTKSKKAMDQVEYVQVDGRGQMPTL